MTWFSAGASARRDVPGQEERPALPQSAIWAIAAGLLALHAALAWYLRTPGIGTGNDDAVYLLLGRALRQWSYSDLFYVGSPTEAQYPPLYPAFLAMIGGLFGERLSLFVAANIVLSVSGLALVFDVIRRQSAAIALLTLAMMAINPLLLGLAGAVRSEPLCLALTGLSLWLLARPAPSRTAEVWAGASAIGAALSRSAAVTLIAGMGLYWLLRRRWGAVAILGVASAITVGSWLAWTVVAPRQLPGRSYVSDAAFIPVAPAPPDPLDPVVPLPEAPSGVATPPTAEPPSRELPSTGAEELSLPSPDSGPRIAPPAAPTSFPATLALRFRTNLRDYTRALLQSVGVSTYQSTRGVNLSWLLLLATLGLVGIWGVGRWWLVAVLALGCHGLLLVLWPYALPRYLAPLLPYLMLAVFWGAREVDALARRRLPRAAPQNLVPIMLAAGMLVGAVPGMVRRVQESAACKVEGQLPGNACQDPAERAFFEATTYIANHTPDTARFLAAKEAVFYYYTGRRVVPIYQVTAGQVPDLREYLSRHQAEYVFLSHLKLDEWAMVGPLLAICDELELMGSWGATAVLMQLREGTAERPACGALRAYNVAPWGNRLPRSGGTR